MKKILIYFVCVAAIVSCGSSVGDSDKVIKWFKTAVKLLNEAAPIQSPIGTIDGASMNGTEVTVDVTLGDIYSKMVDSGAMFDERMAAMSFVMSMDAADHNISSEDIKTSGISIKCCYRNPEGALLKEGMIGTEDIMAAYERLHAKGDAAPLNDRQFYIDYIISSTAPALPMDAGNGVVFDSIYENALGVEMKYVLTDPVFEYVDVTTEMEESMMDALLEELRKTYKYMQFIYEDMAKCGIVYTYTYVSKGARELVKITVPISEVVE